MPASLRQVLNAVESRRRRLLVIARLAEVVVAAVVLLCLIMVWDAFAQPGVIARRIATFAAVAALVTGITARLIVPMWRRRSDFAIARAIERRRPDLREGLSSAIAFIEGADPQASRWMVARTVALAAQEAGALEPVRLVSPRPARHRLGWASLALAVLAVILVTPSGSSWFLRAVLPWLPTVRPSPYRITVRSATTLVPRGAPYLIDARIEPEPREVHADLVWEDGIRERLRLEGSGSRFALDLPAVTQAFRYRIIAEGGESVEQSVGVVDAPAIEEILVTIGPPAYTEQPARTTAAGDLEVVAGSRISLDLRGAEGLRGAVLVSEGDLDQPFAATVDGTFRASFLADATRTWGIRLIGEGGLMVEPAARWLLTVRPDAAPRVDLGLIQGSAAVAGAEEKLLLRARAVDDHGLRSVEMVLSDRDGEIERQDLLAGRVGAPRTLDRVEGVAIAQHGLHPGDELRIRLEAVDQGGLRSVGEDLTVRIVTDPVAESARLALRLRAVIATMDRMLADLRAADRTWSGLQRTFRADDPAAQRGELLLLGAKLTQICERTTLSGGQVRDLGVATDAPVGPRLLMTGDALRAWGLLQRRILAGSLALATAQGQAEDIQRSRDLTDNALRTLEPLRGSLVQIVARLEVEALVATIERGAASVRAAVPVLAGIEAWRQPLRQPGLLLTVFAGTDAAGEVLRRGAAPPTLAAVLESGRSEQVSARWEGEMRIPRAGRYRFQVTVDDGARLAVAGSQLLPAEAWSWQAPTPYQGSVDLEEGWCDLLIEFRQGGGGAAFEVVWSLADGPFQPLTTADLRCRIPGTSDAEVLAAMLTASPVAAMMAEANVREAMSAGALVDERLEAIALDTGRDRIQALAKAARKDAQALRDAAKQGGGGSALAEDAAGHLARLLRVVNLAREHLRDAVDKVGQAGDPLGIERAMVRELAQRGEALKAIPRNLPDADRLAAARRETTAAMAIAEALELRLTGTRQGLLDRARGTEPILAERLALLAARSGLADLFSEGENALTSLRQLPEDATQARSAINSVSNDLDRRLGQVSRHLAEAQAIRLGHLVDAVQAAIPAWEADSGQDPIRRERLRAAADAVVSHLRQNGQGAIAVQVLAASAELLQHRNGDALRRRLKDLGSRPEIPRFPWGQALGDGERALSLLGLAEIETTAADRVDQAREELRAIATALGIAQGPGFPTTVDQRARARSLAEAAEMLALSLDPNLPAAQDIVEGIRLLAAERQDSEAASEAEGLLADLARQARAAVQDEEARQHLRGRLADLVPGRSEDAPDRDRLLATVEGLESNLARERRLISSEERERLEFAAVTQATADVLDAAARAWDAGDTSRERSTAQALARAGSDARRRAELARASAALPGAESIDLASAARQAGDAVRAGPLRALAAEALAADPAGRSALAEVALGVADALQAQDQAAERLAASAARREENRAALASGRAEIIAWYDGIQDDDSEIAAVLGLGRQTERVLALASTAPPEELIAALGEAIAAQQAWATAGSAHSAQALAQVAGDLHRLRQVASDLAAAGDPDIRQQARSLAVQAHQAIMRMTQDSPILAEHAVAGVLADPILVTAQPDRPAPGVMAEAAAILDGPVDAAAWRQVATILDRASLNAAGIGSGGATSTLGDSGTEEPEPDPLLIEAVSGDDQAEWVRSRGEVRGSLHHDGAEAFAEEHRAAIRAYFQRLGSEGGR